ncbi:UNVERIFIED_CONTAM: hypothetical protein GTU68_022545 [Idotea baltica]|nr:hypothetical protein [Idotea baltica]
MEGKKIKANELNSLLEDKRIILIDVRETEEFQSEHIAGAINIPLSSNSADKLEQLLNSKECVFQCASGIRAANLFSQLSDTHKENSCLLDGGINAWKKEGFMINSNSSKLSIFRQVQIIAGFFIFIGTISGLLINSLFLIIPIFFGLGLFFAGTTGWCGMGILLQKMPWNK